MQADYVLVDLETRAVTNLKTAGVYRYTECPHFDVMCMGFQWPEGEPAIWMRGEPFPKAVFDHIRAGRRVVVHNAEFELACFAAMNRRDPNWPRIEPEQTDDTLQRGRQLGLPGSLDDMLGALRLPYTKDKEGYALMLSMCKPRKPRKGEPKDVPIWNETPEQQIRQAQYCLVDVIAEHALLRVLPPLSPKQHELWCFNERINQRGVLIDVAAAQAAMDAVDAEQARLNAQFFGLTGEAVAKGTERDKILAWLETQGIVMGSLRKSDVQAMLDDPDALAKDSVARTVLELRKEAAKASTAKLKAMLRRACADGRVRGMYAFNGANTGRFAGRGVQTQNLPRPSKGFKPRDAAQVIEWLQRGPKGIEAIRLWYGPPMDAIASSLRSFIIAAPGMRFVQGDMSQIEGRVLAWLAGERWKLDAYKAYDTFKLGPDGKPLLDAKGDPVREGPDLYHVMAAGVLGKRVEDVTEDERQIQGKVPELALGYQGGVGAFMSMGANYGICVVKRREDAPKNAKFVMTEAEADEIKLKWRENNPAITRYWYDSLEAAIEAVRRPGTVVRAGKVHYVKTGDFLLCVLPSGDCLYYPYPELRVMTTTFYEREVWRLQKALEDAEDEAHTDEGARHYGAIKDILQDLLDNPDRREQLTYWGVSSKSKNKSWGLQRAYGGVCVENQTQAIATGTRGMLGEAMLACKRRGIELVMHSHDELVAETSDVSFSSTDLAQIICAPVDWAHGLPMAAAGYESLRYRK